MAKSFHVEGSATGWHSGAPQSGTPLRTDTPAMTALNQRFYRSEWSTFPTGSVADEEYGRDDLKPAPTREVTFKCPGLERKGIPGHTFTVTVHFGAKEMPPTWQCRKHGA